MEWMIKCISKPDMVERRAKTIDAHRDHLDRYKAETWYSGPMMVGDGSNANGSFRVVDFPTRAEAQAYIDTDPYSTAAIFRTVDIERVVPWTDVRQRDYAQTEGNAQFIVLALTDPAGLQETPSGETARFLAEHDDAIVFAGALADEAGAVGLGALYVIDVADRDAADIFLAGEPVSRGPDGRSLSIERWRFGHV
jgi:uncharacterized protein YciI